MYLVIQTSTDSKRISELITNDLLKNNLSPCINISNKTDSHYIWNEKILNDKEYIIRIKCLNNDKNRIISIIKELHNYEIPEIISYEFNILDNLYEEWFKESTKRND